MQNLFFYVALFANLSVFSSGKLFSYFSRDEIIKTLFKECKAPEDQYKLGIKFRNGEINDYPKDSPQSLQAAISCFIPEANNGKENALHNIGSALYKLKLKAASYSFFSVAALKGLQPSINMKQRLKDEMGPTRKVVPTSEDFKTNVFEEDVEQLNTLIKKFPDLRRELKLKNLDKFVFGEAKAPSQSAEMLERKISLFQSKLPPFTLSTKRQLSMLESNLSTFVADFQNRCIVVLGELREPSGGKTPSRDPALIINYYNEIIKTHFKTLLKISSSLFDLLLYYKCISKTDFHRITHFTKDYCFGYIKESIENPPIPFCVPQISKSLQLFPLPHLLFNPNYQSAVLMDRSGIITSPGLIIIQDEYFDEASLATLPIEIKFYTGEKFEPHFSVSSYSHLLNPLLQGNIEAIVSSVFTSKELEGLKTKQHDLLFIPLVSHNEKEASEIFEILALEDLIAMGKNPSDVDHQKALEYIAAIEEQEGKPIEEVLKEYTSSILSANEEAIIKEQSEVSKLVAENQIQGRSKNKSKEKKKKGRKGKGKGKGKAKSKAEPSCSPSKPFDLKKGASEKFEFHKQEGRIKYDKALSLLGKLMRRFTPTELLKVNISGSHIKFHGESASHTPTLVRCHGSDDNTISARSFNKFASQLIYMFFSPQRIP